jgi:hypothetical protein
MQMEVLDDLQLIGNAVYVGASFLPPCPNIVQPNGRCANFIFLLRVLHNLKDLLSYSCIL